MVAFNDRKATNALWKIPEGMDFVLLVYTVSKTMFCIEMAVNKSLVDETEFTNDP